MNAECLSRVKRKHRAWRTYIQTLNRRDYLRYCKARNECTKATRLAKRNFESNIIKNVKEDSKGFWSYVRDKTKSRSVVSDLKNPDGEILQGDIEKADLLNDPFASVFISEPAGQLPVFDIRYHGTPVTSLKTNIVSLTKHLNSLNVGNSMGPGGCHPRLLRETVGIVNTPLQIFFNKSFIEGKIPTVWKDANVSALYKNKGDKCETTNYRPVSLMCLPCPLCEKTVRKVIMDHMTQNNLFSDCQYGFRTKRSCILQLLDVLDDWTKSYDNSEQIHTVYLDIKKAFGSVPYQRLLLKIQKYGFEGEILKRIEDFLKDRRQRVVFNGKYSDWRDVTFGIPQGSVLGPVLFIIYMNDMPDSLGSFCKIFADDSKIYTAVGCRANQQKLQLDLMKLSEWSRLWLMEFSVQKYKTIQYGNIKYEFKYQMEDKNGNLQVLPSDTKEKDLGIWFENTLKFDSHITYIVKRANRLVGLIKRTFRSLDSTSFLTLYKSLVRSILDFGGTVFNPHTKKEHPVNRECSKTSDAYCARTQRFKL